MLERSLKLDEGEFIAYSLCRKGYNPFEVLISIILSQNTRDDLALTAFNNLKNVLGVITPDSVLNSPISEIENALRIAGLYKRKSKVIVELAKVLKSLDIDEGFTKLSNDEVRELLLSINGVGYKTVDVFMLMCRGVNVFPIDTHIRRVLARLSITNKGDDYLEIQKKVHKLLPPNYYLKAHLLLIELGRSYCKARKPLCSKCPLNDVCPKNL